MPILELTKWTVRSASRLINPLLNYIWETVQVKSNSDINSYTTILCNMS